ncbi:MAG: hypothetical protein AABY22_35225 [Nanoarchaeota archaeon]
MKKYKWYKDKWGWLGAILLSLIVIKIGSGFSIFNGRVSFVENFRYMFVETYGGYIFLVSGFLIGILLHKLFIKFKWVKR